MTWVKVKSIFSLIRQQIAMARLFYHQPDYAILDECTSNTALNMETLL